MAAKLKFDSAPHSSLEDAGWMERLPILDIAVGNSFEENTRYSMRYKADAEDLLLLVQNRTSKQDKHNFVIEYEPEAVTVFLLVWGTLVSGFITAAWFLLPLFARKVIVPIQRSVQEDWDRVAIAFFVVGGVSVFPLVLLPAGAFIWLAAACFGIWKSFLLVEVGTFFGMSASFLLGKQLLRDRMRRWVEKKDWAQALFIAVKEAGPYKVVLLMRLGPAPYALLSYACSMSPDIKFWPYILASVIGRAPHNIIDIYVGTGVNTAGEAASGKSLEAHTLLLYVLSFLLALALTAWGYVYAKRALSELRARAQAREQVLTDFTFPELDDCEAPDGQILLSDGDSCMGFIELQAVHSGLNPSLKKQPEPKKQLSTSGKLDSDSFLKAAEVGAESV